ncbi:MAG TPA: hypothetical protein VLJ61_15415 [Pyrinomonadaceae bacterium]|nr:hypothetical protein [Pyrinomonadaceae bacterium]
MRPDRLLFSRTFAHALVLLFACAFAASAQTPGGACKVNTPAGLKVEAPASPDVTTGIKITVTGADGKPVQRKRFFLLARSAAASGLDFASVPKRADFLAGASQQLRDWLARHDCDSLYCPDYENDYAEAVKTVPEFKQAYEEGQKKYHNDKLALQWVTDNFPLKNVRTEYYKRKKAWLEQAAQKSGRVSSVMTDEKGNGYFLNVKVGSYYVSNLLPLDAGGVLWDCQVTAIPPVPNQLNSVTVVMTAAKQAASLSPR